MNVDLRGLSKADADAELHFWLVLGRAPMQVAFDVNLVAGGFVYSVAEKQQRLYKMGRRAVEYCG